MHDRERQDTGFSALRLYWWRCCHIAVSSVSFPLHGGDQADQLRHGVKSRNHYLLPSISSLVRTQPWSCSSIHGKYGTEGAQLYIFKKGPPVFHIHLRLPLFFHRRRYAFYQNK